MTQTATTELDLDNETIPAEPLCTTCGGDGLLPCPTCLGALGPRHSCAACDADETACDCPACDNDGLICCPSC